jgi:hypothetical protein
MAQLFQTFRPHSTKPLSYRAKTVRPENGREKLMGLALISLQTHALHFNKVNLRFRRGPLDPTFAAVPTRKPKVHRHKMSTATKRL